LGGGKMYFPHKLFCGVPFCWFYWEPNVIYVWLPFLFLLMR